MVILKLHSAINYTCWGIDCSRVKYIDYVTPDIHIQERIRGIIVSRSNPSPQIASWTWFRHETCSYNSRDVIWISRKFRKTGLLAAIGHDAVDEHSEQSRSSIRDSAAALCNDLMPDVCCKLRERSVIYVSSSWDRHKYVLAKCSIETRKSRIWTFTLSELGSNDVTWLIRIFDWHGLSKGF